MTDELVTVDQAADVLLHGGKLKVMDPEVISRMIASRILEASSINEILNQQTNLKVEDIEGEPLTIQSASFMSSGFKEGPGIYAIIQAVRENTGEVVNVSCGGTNVLAQIIRAMQLGAMPFRAYFARAANPTANGYYPLWLSALPEPAVQG